MKKEGKEEGGEKLTSRELHGVDVAVWRDLGVGLEVFGVFDAAVHDVG